MLSTERHMKISGITTGWIMPCSKPTKSSNPSVLNATSRIGVQCHILSFLQPATYVFSNSRTHRLLDELNENGLKGELVDFV